MDIAMMLQLESALIAIEEEVRLLRRSLVKLNKSDREGDKYEVVARVEYMTNDVDVLRTKAGYLQDALETALDLAVLQYNREGME